MSPMNRALNVVFSKVIILKSTIGPKIRKARMALLGKRLLIERAKKASTFAQIEIVNAITIMTMMAKTG